GDGGRRRCLPHETRSSNFPGQASCCRGHHRRRELMTSDPFEARRAALREEFFSRLFLLGGWIGGTDTYKRTMWAAVPDIARARAAYTLTMRRGLPEEGAGKQLIMAGHEAMLAQWFHRPLRRSDIELAA